MDREAEEKQKSKGFAGIGREKGQAYRFFGVQELPSGGVVARVWAPKAWDLRLAWVREDQSTVEFPMRKDADGVWSVETEGIPGWGYFFRVKSREGWQEKADPYGRWFDGRRPWIARWDVPVLQVWQDGEWCRRKVEKNGPMHIYEVHAGSWRRNFDGSGYSFSQLREELIPYVKKMGYTHIELMPVMEHPYAPSWGYQVTGFFAPSARYGSPEELQKFVQACHREEIGVILDWVPAHFPKDVWGLYRFDGEACYEDEGEGLDFSEWGTVPFDYAKEEVREFLISSAVFWMKEYHFDGIRMDAVAAILSGEDGCSGGKILKRPRREGLRPVGVAFLQELNATLERECPWILRCGEDSSAFAGGTAPVDEGGLQFDYKWNMGWMHDTLEYMSLPFSQRSEAHERLTFPMMYAFSARHILPLSHDEVVYGKGSLFQKMPGTRQEKLAGVRLLLTYMMCHPGKKLTFMGSELAQPDEWKFQSELQWGLEEFEPHRRMQEFVAELNRFYRQTEQLWRNDEGWDGFRWSVVDDRENSVIVFLRQEHPQGVPLVVVCNFSPKELIGYRFGVPEGEYREVWNTDAVRFGGEGRKNPPLRTGRIPSHGFGTSVEVKIPPLSAICFLPETAWKDRKP